MDRRTFLGLTAVASMAGLTGCTDSGPRPIPTVSASAQPQLPDDALRDVTFASEQDLVSSYATAILSADPDLADQLRALQAHHVAHAGQLRPGIPVPTEPPMTRSGAPTPTSSSGPESVRPALRHGSESSPGRAVLADATASSRELGAVTSSATDSSPAPIQGPPRAAVAALRGAEQASLRQRRDACEQADDPDLARSLCLIAASEAQHVAELRALLAELDR